MKRLCPSFAALAGLLVLASSLHAATVTVFAAASLTGSLKEIAATHERQTGDRVIFNFAGSGLLARQIQEGAPADLFFSADEARMNALETNGWIVPETRRNRLSNALVIVKAADSAVAITGPNDLAGPRVKRVALGEPQTVPAGAYAKEYLTGKGLWPAIKPKAVPCESARAVLAAVESGNVDTGIVYRTDAAISKQVKVVLEVPVGDGPKIRYPLALVKNAKQPEAARRFLECLNSAPAGEVFAKHGFIVIESIAAP